MNKKEARLIFKKITNINVKSIEEIYSGFLNLDDNALKSITTPCELEEMKILRHK